MASKRKFIEPKKPLHIKWSGFLVVDQRSEISNFIYKDLSELIDIQIMM